MRESDFAPDAPGRLVQVRGTYRTRYGIKNYSTVAFEPNALPVSPQVSNRVMGAVARAEISLARLDQMGAGLKNPTMLLRPVLRREAQSTSAIEGTYEPLGTVLADSWEPGQPKVDMAHTLQEIFNWIDAANAGIDAVRAGRPICVALARQLQQLLIGGKQKSSDRADYSDRVNSVMSSAGRIRESQVFIGSPTERIEDARFVPTPPDDLGIKLQELFDWWSGRTDPGLAVLDMALFHYQFETLYPFADGNGRIGRLLVLLQAMATGILHLPLLSISPWFERHRADYQDLLLGVSQRGDWESWELFFATAIEESADSALERVRQLDLLSSQWLRKVDENRWGARTRQMVTLVVSYCCELPDSDHAAGCGAACVFSCGGSGRVSSFGGSGNRPPHAKRSAGHVGGAGSLSCDFAVTARVRKVPAQARKMYDCGRSAVCAGEWQQEDCDDCVS